jgi:hypothetical protein
MLRTGITIPVLPFRSVFIAPTGLVGMLMQRWNPEVIKPRSSLHEAVHCSAIAKIYPGPLAWVCSRRRAKEADTA